jgi:hypothetical protein
VQAAMVAFAEVFATYGNAIGSPAHLIPFLRALSAVNRATRRGKRQE